MKQGRVYLWKPDREKPQGGVVTLAEVSLRRLDADGGLSGVYVQVRNGVVLNIQDPVTGTVSAAPLGNALPDANGDYFFNPGMGGGRIDRFAVAPADFRERYIQAARFGEVNAYYHADLMAAYVSELLEHLSAPSLPKVTVVVNAHASTITDEKGNRDGVKKGERWLPFQGGHYRLPASKYRIKEPAPISPTGEIHLGPGWSLKPYGALRECSGRDRYRPNASHNAGIIYHEYAHHLCRHTADFQANALRALDRQDNRKCPLEEGVCDYWAATMLDTPLLWAPLWSRYPSHVHPRSLTSAKTMADFDFADGADSHANGTIWAAALWDARTALSKREQDGVRTMDRIVMQALLLIGRLTGTKEPPTVKSVRGARATFSVGAAAILEAEERLFSGRNRDLLARVFAQRGMEAEGSLGDCSRL